MDAVMLMARIKTYPKYGYMARICNEARRHEGTWSRAVHAAMRQMGLVLPSVWKPSGTVVLGQQLKRRMKQYRSDHVQKQIQEWEQSRWWQQEPQSSQLARHVTMSRTVLEASLTGASLQAT